ncbi:hypothetical protein ACHWQZ_G015527 [Mnemiopsis leidyi]
MRRLQVLLFSIFNLLGTVQCSVGWLVGLKYGGHQAADKIARKFNLVNKGRRGSLDDVFLFVPKAGNDQQRRDTTAYIHERERDNTAYETDTDYTVEMIQDISNQLFHETGVMFAQLNRKVSRKPRGTSNNEPCCQFNDPQYEKQWYLRNTGGPDMHLEGAWKQGFTGKGVTVTILDDGVEKTHDDLKANWDPAASYDFNNDDSDPSPSWENFHGTRCAGQVAAAANNSKCGVGAAFQASIGGIRMLDGRITDEIECNSLGFKRNYIDIYSISWGPDDDGRTVDGPYSCTKRALKTGAKKGRHGKGSIFVWASGNGGSVSDDCNADGYVSSIYTIAISAISSRHQAPSYSESCACTLASAYSAGFSKQNKIFTTDVDNTCTNKHTGSSAASPLAAGIFALVLQANPGLTWRDMQHLIVRTARSAAEDRDSQWETNGAGHEFHPKLGFGVLDATAMVNVAQNWTTVALQRRCSAVKATRPNMAIRPLRAIKLKLTVNPNDCKDRSGGKNVRGYLRKLEHVKLYLTMSTPHTRGEVVVRLTSPSGTTSNLLSRRPKDRGAGGDRSRWETGFQNWGLMTVNFWDENPYGRWKLQIGNFDRNQTNVLRPTKLKSFKLVFWGSEGMSESDGAATDFENFAESTVSSTPPITYTPPS